MEQPHGEILVERRLGERGYFCGIEPAYRPALERLRLALPLSEPIKQEQQCRSAFFARCLGKAARRESKRASKCSLNSSSRSLLNAR